MTFDVRGPPPCQVPDCHEPSVASTAHTYCVLHKPFTKTKTNNE